ncbi:MAG: FAD-dependent oxidoreductase [Gemmatimonadota bacterium]|nr:FAD-dependent oxidoreductase [Gemmatimonadota bacterium]MDH3479768.1 FAD-dependent oxidoreductase [Gemmatimonadota bacterium]MDH5549795.1 FAD-dependent oxidoreductase [Gemmatimonadota bacterium]
MTRTLVLGAGFGGITVATELRRRLGDDHEIVLVDRRERFAMGLRKLWALVGMGSYEEGSRPRERLGRHGVQFLQRPVTSIDPAHRRAATDGETLEADYLVVALGAEPRPDLVPGLAQHAHNVWDERAVPGLATALARFTGGRIAIVIAGVPYTCPPAPYECAMLLDDHLRERGVRDKTEITVATMQPMLLPNAGKEGSAWLAEQLSARGIAFHVKRTVDRVEPGRVVFTDGDLVADLIIGVPPHRVPAVVKASGLTGDGEWIAVDPATLETDYKNVFAIGDVTKITLANGLPLPKAGVMAELEGQRVAAAIAADVRGEAPPASFDGRGYCFIEMGKTKATLIEGDFFATPEPRVALKDVSAEHAEEKHRFEAERLERWFGSGRG